MQAELRGYKDPSQSAEERGAHDGGGESQKTRPAVSRDHPGSLDQIVLTHVQYPALVDITRDAERGARRGPDRVVPGYGKEVALESRGIRINRASPVVQPASSGTYEISTLRPVSETPGLSEFRLLL
jgi:hypothetical protein